MNVKEKLSVIFSFVWHKVLANIVATFFAYWIIVKGLFPEPNILVLVLFGLFTLANIIVEPLAMVVYETAALSKLWKQTKLEEKENA